MSWGQDEVLQLTREEAAEQWRRIASRQPAPPGGRQETFTPVEVVLCTVASLFVNHRQFGGGTTQLAPSPVPELAEAFTRPPSSVLAKMANLDGTRSHGAVHDEAVGAILREEPGRLMALLSEVLKGADLAGVRRPMPPLRTLRLLPEWLGTPVSGAVTSYLVSHWQDEIDATPSAEQRQVSESRSDGASAELPDSLSVEQPEGATEDAHAVDEDRMDAEESVAELLADLSRAAHVPLEVRGEGKEIAPEDVDFRSGDWLATLSGLQDWLRLGQRLDVNDPAAGVRLLAVELGEERWGELVSRENPGQLSMAGLEALRQRLERAVQLKDSFAEEIEGNGSSLRAATGAWLTAWEESAEDDEVEAGGAILAEADVWPISDLKAHAEKGRLNLSPSYQRGDVWPTVDAQILMESILRGIPLPSVILLRATEDGRQVYEVIDGKQRLTAILRFTASHPAAIASVERVAAESGDTDLMSLFRYNYPAFRKRWQKLTGESLTANRERSLYFPFKLRTGSAALSAGMAHLQGKYYSQIRDVTVEVAGRQHEVSDIFETNSTKYKLPMITYDDAASPQQIHEVFNLYNKQGKHLNAEEIRNARYHKLDLMRGMLAAAGDAQEPLEVAPFLTPCWDEVRGLSGVLDVWGVRAGRYQATKVVAWVAALLASDSVVAGKVRQRSTAAHINAWLDRVEMSSSDPLRNAGRVNSLLQLISVAARLHAQHGVWDDKFRNARGAARWQELQLVASLTGVALAVAAMGEEATARRMQEVADLIASRSSREWKRPAKTQTAQQWAFISQVAIELVDLLEVSVDEADFQLRQLFGESGVRALSVSAGRRWS